jgi:hypothetical protein
MHTMKLLLRLVFFLAFLWLGGCQGASKSELYPENQVHQAGSSSFSSQEKKAFLALYAPLDSFPVLVSTKIGEWEGPQSPKFNWKGRPLPEKYWHLFDSQIREKHQYTGEAFYANKRFRVNHQTQALITRVPGQYWSGQVYLFLLHLPSFRITGAYRLAEAWADTGDSFYLESKLHKTAANQFRLEGRQQECHPQDENYRTFLCSDTLTEALLRDNAFTILSRKPAGDREQAGSR